MAWITKTAVALGGLAVTLLASLWLEHKSAVTLPSPSGPFVVGRSLYDWRDKNALDPLSPGGTGERELFIWIWYPATPGPPVDEYLPASLRSLVERRRGVLLGHFLTRDLSRVHVRSLRAPVLSTAQAQYPVVLLRAGASAGVWNYTSLAEDLASHGYVVVGFDAPYRTSEVVFPDGRAFTRQPENNPELCLEAAADERERCAGRILNAWTADLSFVLDRLAQLNASDSSGRFVGRLDMARIGVAGHSFGGAAALSFCREDSRCKAGVDLDGAPHGSVIQEGVGKPFMFLLSDHSRETDAESRQIMANLRAIYDRLPANERIWLEIRGANHFLFSDDGALLKSRLVLAVLRAFGRLGIDGRRQLAVTSYCLENFFDATLKQSGALPIGIPDYPEIQVRR